MKTMNLDPGLPHLSPIPVKRRVSNSTTMEIRIRRDLPVVLVAANLVVVSFCNSLFMS